MIKFKGTKGTWTYAEGYCHRFKQPILSINDEEEAVEGLAVVYTGADEMTEEAEANARLIAAAPELLDALQFMVERFGKRKDLLFSQRLAIQKAEDAIDKATGAKKKNFTCFDCTREVFDYPHADFDENGVRNWGIFRCTECDSREDEDE